MLAAEYGTPLYVLDEATVRATAATFVAALRSRYPHSGSVHYASKALLNTAVAQLIADCGLGLDCVSLGELATARRAGVDFAEVHLHGNAKPRAELQQALAWGTGRIMVDSLDELRMLRELTAGRAAPQAILLRLNPGIDVHTHAHVQTGQLDSKFGLPIATGMAEQAVVAALDAPGLRLDGFHMHLGSQISAVEPIRRGIVAIFEFAAAMRTRYGWEMRELSPGGGLAVPYAPGDPDPSVEEYVGLLAAATLESARIAQIEPPRLIVEPGRALIARAVVALYSVLSVKDIPGVRRFVAVDGGMGDNIRPALYEARYHAIRPDQPNARASDRVTVVGRYCESGDVLLKDTHVPPLEPGALLALPMAGAYTLSMASNYNLVPRPALVLVREGSTYLIQRRETPDDLAARDVPLPSYQPSAFSHQPSQQDGHPQT
jgi:diaminopimelate decarboxylase